MDQISNEQPKKLIFKFWWFWVIIATILIGLFITAWILGHNQDKNQYKSSEDRQIDGESKFIYDSSLPDCPSDMSAVLTQPIFDIDKVDAVMPLGMLSPGGHTIPTDHMYIDHFGTGATEIRAPGNITLVGMDDKITYDSATDSKIRDDYSIEFALCKGAVIYLNHFSEIEPKIKDAWDKQKDKMCETDNKWHFGDDTTTYYQPCQANFKLSFKAGELLGHIGTMAERESESVQGMDLGYYNFNMPALAFANPSRYQIANLHAYCGIDLFTKDIKDAYYAKLGDVSFGDQETRANPILIPRVGEPLCGATMQDVPGTLAGNWFAGTSANGSVTSNQYMIAFAVSLSNANIKAISIQGQTELGGNSLTKFTPLHAGTINREFSEVTPSETVYCYQPDEALNEKPIIDKNGKPKSNDSNKFLVQLVDATHLNIERQSGICSASEEFKNPLTYER